MPRIRQSLIIAAPAETVYDALATPEGLSAWWSPDVTREAGGFRIAFGPTYAKQFAIDALTPPHSVRWRCTAGAAEWVGTTISFDLHSGSREHLLAAHPEATDQLAQLEPFEQGTQLALTHADWRSDSPMFAECSYTWGRFLRSVKRLCETSRGRPWPLQHRVVGEAA